MIKNRPHLTPSICLEWNLKRIIVQWVGIGTHRHTHTHIVIVMKLVVVPKIVT